MLARLADVDFAWARRARNAASLVLSGITLDVHEGERVALLGPNGSGKSTLLTLLAGLARPNRGTVTWTFDGRSFAPTSPEVRARLGVVFQHPALDGQLTARENLHLAARIAALPGAEARAAATALLVDVDLTEHAERRVKTFSGGMRRRLDLARALIAEPDVLLLDEPTSGLDLDAFERFWRRLESPRAPSTLVVATHRPDEAARCDRLVMIDQGRIVLSGSPTDLVRALGKDLLVITASDPAALGTACTDLVTRVTGPDTLTVEVPADHDAAQLLVRLVERFPAGRIDAIALRRPTLADLFTKVTGRSLSADDAAGPNTAAASRRAA